MLSGFLKKLSGSSNKESTTTKASSSNAEAKSLVKPALGIGVRTIGSANNKVSPKTLDRKSTTTIGESTQSIEPNLILEIDKDTNTELNLNKTQIKSEPIKLELSSKVNTVLEKSILVAPSTAIEEEIATTFSEGEDNLAIQTIKEHFKEKNGSVDQRIWFMLMDLYQILNDTQEFEKVALSYAQVFGTSPPSWFGNNSNTEDKKTSIGGGKNMIILEPILDASYIDKFRDLYKVAKKENFCRINVSQCKFEQNDPQIIEKFLKLMVDLKKSQTIAVLMGDNNLISFCKKFIEDPNFKNHINPAYLENEQVVWLLYLEILQWKGQSEEFENVALNFAEKFEVSPPGWDNNGIMDLNKHGKSAIDSNIQIQENISFEKNLNINNVNVLLDYIKNQFEKEDFADIDLSNVERIDFSAAGAISFHIQELWSNHEYANKKVIIRNPNELIIVLLHMVGATEFVSIIPRQRK